MKIEAKRSVGVWAVTAFLGAGMLALVWQKSIPWEAALVGLGLLFAPSGLQKGRDSDDRTRRTDRPSPMNGVVHPDDVTLDEDK